MAVLFFWIGLLLSAIYIESFIKDCINKKEKQSTFHTWLFAIAISCWVGLFAVLHK